MGLFRRRRRDLEDEAFRVDGDYADSDARYDDGYEDGYEDEYGDHEAGEVGGDLFDDAGPYDVEDVPEDGVPRIDLGALRLPVTAGQSELKVRMRPDGTANEAYLITDICVLTVGVFAAPRSAELWREEWCGDLARDMRAKGAAVHSAAGAWGQELLVSFPGEVNRFVGVDGPRWMMRAVATSAPERAENAAAALYELVRGTVVVRGEVPMPVGMPLPLQLPPALAAHIRGQAGIS
ncbi:DUF3710 domain-containing protein [Actinophytocola xanthii]|uniref:DUF3710 domain-containing protein n=1 Tax=Actinophytocola xanthii TaxID=1912961 RepID=A0A1Q8CRF1_9PSEU|nr:DUF3710 domain-containing protein [Actinophytocola xanthii]OLF16917.1 hypothetical protein BU204_14580 [Actinophytocola xanthii]